jgi:hypothetical protein
MIALLPSPDAFGGRKQNFGERPQDLVPRARLDYGKDVVAARQQLELGRCWR